MEEEGVGEMGGGKCILWSVIVTIWDSNRGDLSNTQSFKIIINPTTKWIMDLRYLIKLWQKV